MPAPIPIPTPTYLNGHNLFPSEIPLLEKNQVAQLFIVGNLPNHLLPPFLPSLQYSAQYVIRRFIGMYVCISPCT